jgi:hypothetical protein
VGGSGGEVSGPQPLFQIGVLVATPAALDAMTLAGDDLRAYIIKHVTLDPGDLDSHDIAANKRAVEDGSRVFSAYILSDHLTKIWIITEADRSSTCVLLPEEY